MLREKAQSCEKITHYINILSFIRLKTIFVKCSNSVKLKTKWRTDVMFDNYLSGSVISTKKNFFFFVNFIVMLILFYL